MSTLRNYIALTNVQVVEATATEAQLDLAEQLIDQYVGWQSKHVRSDFDGEITAIDSLVISDTSSTSKLDSAGYDNYWNYCVVEFMSGSAAGEIKRITASDYSAKTITIDSATTGSLAVGDVFRVYQLAKFPRVKDTFNRDTVFYKAIPKAVQEAVIAQVSFIIEMGDSYFTGEDSEMDSESIMSYNYSRGANSGQSAIVKMLAPKARILLRGIKNRTGILESEKKSWD